MAETVYLYDGSPKLVVTNWDYPNQPYTKIPPDDGRYYPIYFDEDKQKWIGYETSLKNRDLQRLEETINTQIQKFEEVIDRSNKKEKHILKLKRYSANL